MGRACPFCGTTIDPSEASSCAGCGRSLLPSQPLVADPSLTPPTSPQPVNPHPAPAPTDRRAVPGRQCSLVSRHRSSLALAYVLASYVAVFLSVSSVWVHVKNAGTPERISTEMGAALFLLSPLTFPFLLVYTLAMLASSVVGIVFYLFLMGICLLLMCGIWAVLVVIGQWMFKRPSPPPIPVVTATAAPSPTVDGSSRGSVACDAFEREPTVTYRLSFVDWWQWAVRYIATQPLMLLFLTGSMLFNAYNSWTGAVANTSNPNWFGAAALSFTVSLSIMLVIVTVISVAVAMKLARSHKGSTLMLTVKGLHLSSATSRVEIVWSGISRIRETYSLIWIDFHAGGFTLVPKSAFPNPDAAIQFLLTLRTRKTAASLTLGEANEPPLPAR